MADAHTPHRPVMLTYRNAHTRYNIFQSWNGHLVSVAVCCAPLLDVPVCYPHALE